MTPSLAEITEEDERNNRSFSLFPYLNDDLKLTILGYVADAPFEELPDNYIKSSLTHKLPHVNKKFHSLTKCDTYWKTAIARQAIREPFLWRKALARICNQTTRKNKNNNNNSQEEEFRSVNFQRRQKADDTTETNTELIERTYETLGKPTYKSIYKQVVSHHLRFKGPALIYLGRIFQLGVPYELELTEPRYQDVLKECLQDHSVEAREQGGPIDRDAFLVHVNRGPLEERTPAVLVQVLRCHVQQQEEQQQEEENENNHNNTTTTHVVLLPFAHVWLEKAWMRPEDEMVFVQCLKMGKGVTADMNRLARQEALAGLMDQLANDVLTNEDFHLADEYDDDSDMEDDDDDNSSDASSLSSGLSALEELEEYILGD